MTSPAEHGGVGERRGRIEVVVNGSCDSSLAKRKRQAPIEYRVGRIWVHVEASTSRGMATIWGADILRWASSQLVEADAKGLKTSPWLRAVPYQC